MLFFRNPDNRATINKHESKRNLGKNDRSTKTPERITLTTTSSPVAKQYKYTFFVPCVIKKPMLKTILRLYG